MGRMKYAYDQEKVKHIFESAKGPDAHRQLKDYLATDVYPEGSCGTETKRKEMLGLAFGAAITFAKKRGYLQPHHNARVRASEWPEAKKAKFREYFLAGTLAEKVSGDKLFSEDFAEFSSPRSAFDSFAQSIGVSAKDRGVRRKAMKSNVNVAAAEKSDEFPMQAFIDFLGLSRTMREICDKFSKDKLFVEGVFSHLPEGYRFYTQRNAQGDTTYVVLKEHLSGTVGEKLWTCRRQAEGQPYLLVEFPGSFDLAKIKVLPLADIWFGDNLHEKERFDEYVQWIFNTEEAYAVLNGNVFRVFGGGEKEEDVLYETVMAFEEKIRPIAHKILWAISGQNEAQSARSLYDPLDIACQDLGIRHYTEPIYADIVWKGHIFTFFCFAGTTFAQTKGGKINAAIRPMHFQEMVNFTIMGKAQDKIVMKQPSVRRDPQRFKLVYGERYAVICPSFKRYFGSVEAKKGYQPPSWGTVSCNLFPDGSCEYSS